MLALQFAGWAKSSELHGEGGDEALLLASRADQSCSSGASSAALHVSLELRRHGICWKVDDGAAARLDGLSSRRDMT